MPADMTFVLSDEQKALKAAVYDLCRQYPAEYWRELDAKREYPEAFVNELTKAGYLAVLIPEEYGGGGLGIMEAALILEEIGRLSAKLNQLLQFSRPAVLGDGKTTKCDACEVARDVASVLCRDAQTKGIALELAPSTSSLKVAVGTEALNDILTNLVVNALDAAPRGGHVQVGVSKKDGMGLIVVEDDGPGIPKEALGKIFDPFFTTTDGTGLGLSISYGIICSHGGHIAAENRDQGGARFILTLPVRQPAVLARRGERSEA